MTIKLLVVDDSAFMRKIIKDIVDEIDGVRVIAIARNGQDALDTIPKCLPDIITLDVEMPKLNGIETLKIIKEKYKIPVIMLSSHSGTDITIEALQIGALDFIEKPMNLMGDLSQLKIEMENKIKSILNKKGFNQTQNIKTNSLNHIPISRDINAIVIGASTGGPKALVYLISNLPKDLNIPILIVQHMPKDFTSSFAKRLDKESEVRVVEAKDGMTIHRGTVYIAPGDYHMTIDVNKIRLDTREKIHGIRPAADYLFESAAEVYGEDLLGLIMTGMGKDGTAGMESIKNRGGFNIAQSEESCVVYGMPGNAVAKGVVDEIMSLKEISRFLNKIIKVK